MTRYQLAKLVSWADRLHSRKRLQKLVYLLQAGGCSFEVDFVLHHYGPYSDELARLTDSMVQAGLLNEECSSSAVGEQYSYRLTDAAKKQLAEFEATNQGALVARELSGFERQAKELLNEDLKKLEYAATIGFFHNQGCNWQEAVEKAFKFKRTPAVRAALPLAQKVLS